MSAVPTRPSTHRRDGRYHRARRLDVAGHSCEFMWVGLVEAMLPQSLSQLLDLAACPWRVLVVICCVILVWCSHLSDANQYSVSLSLSSLNHIRSPNPGPMQTARTKCQQTEGH